MSAAPDLKGDEVVVFFPTAAHWDDQQQRWQAPIRGMVFEPEHDSLRRRLLISAFGRSLSVPRDGAAAEIFQSRMRELLIDHERGKVIKIALGKHRLALPATGADGQFHGLLHLTSDEVAELEAASPAAGRWLTYQAVLPAGDERQVAGEVQLAPATGLSVISDIDDTIKHTEANDRAAALNNTLLRAPEPIAGMASRYRRLEEAGAVFHYVSASPWQLFDMLHAFRGAAQFPRGSFHLRHWRLSNRTALQLTAPPANFKPPIIRQLLARWPQRRFVLIGDSGQQDAAIYAEIYRDHPEQVVGVCIRRVAGDNLPALQQALANVPEKKRVIFSQPSQLDPLIDQLIP